MTPLSAPPGHSNITDLPAALRFQTPQGHTVTMGARVWTLTHTDPLRHQGHIVAWAAVDGHLIAPPCTFGASTGQGADAAYRFGNAYAGVLLTASQHAAVHAELDRALHGHEAGRALHALLSEQAQASSRRDGARLATGASAVPAGRV